jgi:serine protease AprX
MEAGFRGDGIGVAVLDSGVSPTIDVEAVAEVDIVEPDGLSADYFGHGTHAAGIIAGSGEASLCRSCYRSFRGIAPGARIYSVKVLDGSGKGRVSDVIAGIDWVLRHHEAEGIRVMNISLGHPVDEPYTTDPLCSAVEEAWKAGIVVIVSAGNQGGDGNATITSPGNHPSVITVGAAEDWGSIETSDDIVASFSSLGPTRIDGVLKPDILAPGTGVVSLRSPGSLLDEALPGQVLRLSEYMTDPTFGDGESPYIAMSGTSTAAPAVAAAAALLLSQDRDATPDDIKARLLVSARKMNDSIVARGAGLLDVASALELGAAGLSAVSAPSPRLRIVIDAQGAEAVAFEEIGSAWGDPEAWPSELIWGGQETWGLGESWMAAEAWSAAGQTGVVPFPAEGAFAVWGFR